jgi:tRNA (guanine37-N1)-methyltransferase
MRFDIVTLIPEMFSTFPEWGVTGSAVKSGKAQLHTWNPRDFTGDDYHKVDDRPYGGGPGMVLMYEPLAQAITAAKAADEKKTKVIYLSPQGKLLKQRHMQELATNDRLILVAGRYEGIDERIIDDYIDEELSVGDYVLSGGELAAFVLIDAVTRLLPSVLGNAASAVQDSFTNGILDCPHYTRPDVINDKSVPSVLLSGNHQAINEWRLKQSLTKTWLARPDLLQDHELSIEERCLLDKIKNKDLT